MVTPKIIKTKGYSYEKEYNIIVNISFIMFILFNLYIRREFLYKVWQKQKTKIMFLSLITLMGGGFYLVREYNKNKKNK